MYVRSYVLCSSGYRNLKGRLQSKDYYTMLIILPGMQNMLILGGLEACTLQIITFILEELWYKINEYRIGQGDSTFQSTIRYFK